MSHRAGRKARRDGLNAGDARARTSASPRLIRPAKLAPVPDFPDFPDGYDLSESPDIEHDNRRRLFEHIEEHSEWTNDSESNRLET